MTTIKVILPSPTNIWSTSSQNVSWSPKNHSFMPGILYFHGVVFLAKCLLKSLVCLLPAFLFYFSFSLRTKPNLTHHNELQFSFQILFYFFYYILLCQWWQNALVLVWSLIDMCYFNISMTNCTQDGLILSEWIRLGSIYEQSVLQSAKRMFVEKKTVKKVVTFIKVKTQS